jgi:hypothetical protein
MYYDDNDNIPSEEEILRHARHERHKWANHVNAKRKARGEHPIDSFPKTSWTYPENPLNLKTFIIFDEFEMVEKMNPQELLLYLFKNMLIYECNLIFDENLRLDYFIDTIEVQVSDFKRFLPDFKTCDIPNCERVKKTLFFHFDLQELTSLNKTCQVYEQGYGAKSRQYILFNFYVIRSAFKYLSVKCKDFLLYILKFYHYSKRPIIMHSLSRILRECNISLNKGRKKAIDRINKYFQHLYNLNLVSGELYGYKFKVEDLKCSKPINMQLDRIDSYKD